MYNFQLKTPVVFIIFNRPETTEKVFNEIARAQPPQLFVIADGPRKDNISDSIKCAAAREIINRVDWECEVFTNYSEVNMGCKLRISSGLDWVFENVNEAIILEDDCLPHPDFFKYCEELLDFYREDNRIMHIGGNNFLCARESLEYSYYFSAYSHVWGWATWKRAWKYYDVNMESWPYVRKHNYLSVFFPNKIEYQNRIKIWNSVYEGEIDTWDYQWMFAILSQGGFSILPKNNLISNIGFGNEATHTKIEDKFHSNLEVENIQFPLIHPSFVMRDLFSDLNYTKISDAGKSKFNKLVHFLAKNILNY
ncbi:MAG: methyltransferase FkbM [Methanohalophilus sp.]|nr:MAG: methyltransferase FkbM [Methanohalophilus sp.]